MNQDRPNLEITVALTGTLIAYGKFVLVLALLVFVVSPACAEEPADAKPAEQVKLKGWTDIMPPKDLKGWYRVSVPPGGKLGRAQWHVDVAKRLLICDGDGGHDMLLTEKEYGDAVFHFDFRYTKIEGKKGYNSGAYIRNSRQGKIWHQAQFGDADGGFLFGVTRTTGGQRKFFKVGGEETKKHVKPAGEWNTMEITARGKTLSLRVNGEVTCRFDDCGVERGRVGLEGEGFRVEFRDLRVKELKSQ